MSVWPRYESELPVYGCVLTIWSGSTTGKASGGKSQIIHWRRHRVTAYIGVGSGRPTFSGTWVRSSGSQRPVSCPDFPRLQPFSRLLRQAQEWFNGVQQSEGFLSSQRTITITVGASAWSLDEVKSLGARDSEVAEASSGLARNIQHARRGRSTSYLTLSQPPQLFFTLHRAHCGRDSSQCSLSIDPRAVRPFFDAVGRTTCNEALILRGGLLDTNSIKNDISIGL